MSNSYMQFTLADHFGGVAGIKETYTRLMRECGNAPACVAEIMVTLEQKAAQWRDRDNKIAELYDTLWNTLAMLEEEGE